MKEFVGKLFLALLILTFQIPMVGAAGFEEGIPEGWVCQGTCNTSVANGVVTLSPAGGSRYGWIATTGSSRYGLGLPGIGGTNGSRLHSQTFAAKAGEELEFYFNYVTSDGGGYADYAWARLLDSSLNPVALLFTARTRSSGNVVPGFGMPDIEAAITPETVNIIGGGPVWAPLGSNSGRCYSGGCGYTGWVQSRYTVVEAGEYVLEFGAVNWSDTKYQTGMAFDGILLGGKPIGADSEYQDVRVLATVLRQGLLVKPDTFVSEPVRVQEFADYSEIEWHFDSFSLGQLQLLDFDVTILEPQPGEKRKVVEQVVIEYRDLAGEPHRQVLGPQWIDVLPSVYRLDLALDKTLYAAGETGSILPVIASLGAADGVVALELEIQDATGRHVATLPVNSEIAVAAGEQFHPTPEHLDTTGLYAGDYRVLARLVEADGRVTTATADFQVTVPADLGLTASVAADRDSYSPLEQATLTGRLRNTAPNMQIEDHTVQLRVMSPNGSLFWETEAPLRTLSPGGIHELSHTLPLGAAEAGIYRIELTAFDHQGLTAAVAESAFRVLSSAETGVGLVGQVSATPDPVLRTDPVDIFAEVINAGNDAFQGLPLTLSLVDPEGEREVASWNDVVDLPRDGTHTIAGRWIADLPGGTVLFAVLSAEINGQVRTLAHRTVRVEEKLVSTPAIDGRGRLLVLLDPPRAGQCQAVDGVRVHLPTPQPLAADDLLMVELYDPQGNVVDAESIRPDDVLPVDTSTGAGANLILTEVEGDRVTIDIRSLEAGSPLEGAYRLSATLYQGGLDHHFDSGPLSVDCANLPEPGADYGGFQLVDTDIRADGPEIERRAFLEQLLREHGWSHTVVTSASAFARELRGGYSGYLLQSSGVHLDVQVQRELRERVFAGAGIVMAGVDDHRNHHLLEVAGVNPVGVLPHAEGINPLFDTALEAPDAIFSAEETPLALRLAGAAALAEYRTSRGRPHDQTAIALNDYGNGHSVIAGFELLAQAQAAGVQSGYATFLMAALEYVHPAAITARPGITVPFLWQVHNRGDALTARLQLEIGGTRTVDPGPATADGPTRLWHDFDLPREGTDELRFWWQLPASEDEAWVTGKLSIAEGVVFNEYGSSLHAIPLERLPDFDDIRTRVDAIQVELRHQAGILREMEHAEKALERGRPEQAVFHLLKAADELDVIGGADADAVRVKLAWLIHRIAGQI